MQAALVQRCASAASCPPCVSGNCLQGARKSISHATPMRPKGHLRRQAVRGSCGMRCAEQCKAFIWLCHETAPTPANSIFAAVSACGPGQGGGEG